MRKAFSRTAILVLLVIVCEPNGLLAEDKLPTLHLTDSANNKTVDAKVGQLVVLTLEANPTTGYRWFVQSFPLVIELVNFIYTPKGKEMAGSGGTQTAEFLAKSAGTADLKLEYRRPWEHDTPPVRTFVVKITVH